MLPVLLLLLLGAPKRQLDAASRLRQPNIQRALLGEPQPQPVLIDATFPIAAGTAADQSDLETVVLLPGVQLVAASPVQLPPLGAAAPVEQHLPVARATTAPVHVPLPPPLAATLVEPDLPPMLATALVQLPLLPPALTTAPAKPELPPMLATMPVQLTLLPPALTTAPAEPELPPMLATMPVQPLLPPPLTTAPVKPDLPPVLNTIAPEQLPMPPPREPASQQLALPSILLGRVPVDLPVVLMTHAAPALIPCVRSIEEALQDAELMWRRVASEALQRAGAAYELQCEQIAAALVRVDNEVAAECAHARSQCSELRLEATQLEVDNAELRVLAAEGQLEALQQQQLLEAACCRLQSEAAAATVPTCLLQIANAWNAQDGAVPAVMRAYLQDLGTFCERGQVAQPRQLTLKFLTAIHNVSPQAAALIRGNLWASSCTTLEKASLEAYGLRFSADGVQFRYVQAACEYFRSVNYCGYLQVSMDATAVSPIVKLDQRTRQLVGFEGQTEPMENPEQIAAAFVANKGNKVSQAQLILLAPCARGVTPMPIGIVARGSGKDKATSVHVKSWYEESRRLTGMCGYPLVGLGADGDSAVRAYYEDQCCLQFREDGASDESEDEGDAPAARRRTSGRRPAGLLRGAAALPEYYVCVHRPSGRVSVRTIFTPLDELVAINGVHVPHGLCPITDPYHELKKLRNQLFNGVSRALWLGDFMVNLEHVRVVYREHRAECGLAATDVNVNDKQNVAAAVSLLSLDGKWLNGLDDEGTRVRAHTGLTGLTGLTRAYYYGAPGSAQAARRSQPCGTRHRRSSASGRGG